MCAFGFHNERYYAECRITLYIYIFSYMKMKIWNMKIFKLFYVICISKYHIIYNKDKTINNIKYHKNEKLI